MSDQAAEPRITLAEPGHTCAWFDALNVATQRKIDLEACVEIADWQVLQDFGDEHVTLRRADWNRIVAVARGHKSQAAQRAIDQHFARIRGEGDTGDTEAVG